MQHKIEYTFKVRDRAVQEKDQELFLSTQKGEIEDSHSEGYMKNEKQDCEVLFTVQDEENSNLWVALVRENYFRDGNPTHHAYLIYKFIDEGGDPLITDIVY